MNSSLKTKFSADKENKRVHVQRTFDSSVNNVWAAWTESALLEQWWAPKPWKVVTKSMDFREGGFWLYAMQGPDGTKIWARFDYGTIVPLQYFTSEDTFTDENGVPNSDIAGSDWKITFTATGNVTNVNIELVFKTVTDLEKTMEMGFEEGFKMALDNLEELLKAQ